MYKVLIVEDEINSREGLTHLVKTKKDMYIVSAAEDGLEGLNKAQEFLPDIIITDIKMPKLDGLEMIKRLRELNLQTEFLILSGYAEFKYAQYALTLGVKDYILKPIIPAQVFDLLEKCAQNLKKTKILVSPFNREHFNFLTESENKVLTDFYRNKIATKFFYAVIYIPSLKYISGQWKASLLENPDLVLLYFSDKRFIGIIQPIYSNSSSLFSKLQIIIKKEPSFVCSYDVYSRNEALNWFDNFESLISCIPWSISLNMNLFQKEDYMFKGSQNIKDDHEFRNSLKKAFYSGDYHNCKTIIISYLRTIQGKDYHPKNIITLAASCLFKLNTASLKETFNNYGEFVFIQTINELMSANTFYELEVTIKTYYNQLSSIKNNNTYSKPVLVAINEVKSNYQQPLTLNYIAEKIGITPQYLSRQFAKETTQNFIDYLTSYRIKKAKYLLKSTNLKVYEIAEQIGYPDTKYFCTVFKKISGISPNQFRCNDKV